MSEEMEKLFWELKQYLVQHSSKWNTLCDIEQYIIDLEQENKELFVENMKLKDKLEQQRKEYQETYKDVREEIKELKQEHNVLTEFEKWLEDTYNHVGSTDILEVIRKYDFVFGLEGADIMLKTINFVKCKLQELKEVVNNEFMDKNSK